MIEVILDNLPGGVAEATLQAWRFEEGDTVQSGDEIAELAVEGGVVSVTAPCSGVLAEVYYDEGETIERGEVLCLIEGDEEFAGGEEKLEE